ncbi:hypothetical protein HAX54_039475, partial [Datura stramonium]|nr:hypothetical protein [Datura stramonium]
MGRILEDKCAHQCGEERGSKQAVHQKSDFDLCYDQECDVPSFNSNIALEGPLKEEPRDLNQPMLKSSLLKEELNEKHGQSHHPCNNSGNANNLGDNQ